ncbi:MAG TPA: methyl-accepting chemotaxis protein [Candidatus Limnocylindria bacterium]|nr:methyl-accepting chemotaxis protein [Candidatus Limnocylindria bacterium]
MIHAESPTHAADDDRCAAWLEAIERSRDMTLPLAGAGDAATAARRFVDGLRAEMHDFRAIVEAAAEAAARNALQLDAIVANTAEQSAIVEQAAAAIAEIDRGAAHVAHAASDAQHLAATLAASASGYDEGTELVLARLETLAANVESAARAAGAMAGGAAGIAVFLDELRRIARQARLLGINAAIEAAHLAQAGSGFAIVAGEIKRLGESTAESAHGVGAIDTRLRDATTRLEAAVGEGATIVRGLANDLASARGASAQTGEQVRAFDRATGEVAAIAAEQSASLSAVAGGVEGIARHAHDVAAAAERAARLELGERLSRLRATIDAHRLGERPQQAGTADASALGPHAQSAAAALRARIDADQREILSLVTGIAVAVARNSYEWRAIGTGLASLRAQLEDTTRAIDRTAQGASVAATAAQRMRVALDAMRAGFGRAVETLGTALERAAHVRETVAAAESLVRASAAQAEQAAQILETIDTISGETTLLSLNAAIEAAHAGTAGSGFGIVADEIRRLASTTSRATQEIAAVVAAIAQASAAMTTTADEAVVQTDGVHEEASRMQNGVARLRSELDGSLARAGEVATIVEQQLAALAQVRTAAERALEHVERDTLAANDGRRFDLAMLGMRAHALAGRRPLGTVAEEIRGIGLALSAEMDDVFEAAIARGAIRLEDCFDTGYVELRGAAIARLARLFDVSKAPPEGFDPPKFETAYDRAVEDGFNALIDRAVPSHPAIAAMFAVDLNGYCFGHYRTCREDWTGDRARDLAHNRIKRFFEDELSLRCSRVGLGVGADELPARTPYATFAARGCRLRREGERPWAIFTYARDTGTVYNDLSLGLFARGHRVATIRIIYDADVI